MNILNIPNSKIEGDILSLASVNRGGVNMARQMYELNKIINQCVLNTLMTIKLCGGDDGFDELAMIRCVAIRLDQITDDDSLGNLEHLEDFDIDYYIEAYIECVNMEDFNNDQKDV